MPTIVSTITYGLSLYNPLYVTKCLRAQYEDGYYAAFVIDPDGHNIEAVSSEKAKVPPIATSSNC